MWSNRAIESSWSIEIAPEDNAIAKLWFLWRHVKIKKKCKSCIINHIPRLKCLIFLCFWVELYKTLEMDGQEIKILTRMKKFQILGKICCFIKNKNEFLNIIRSFWNLEHLLNMVMCTKNQNFSFSFLIKTAYFTKTWNVFIRVDILISCPPFSRVLHSSTKKHRKIRHFSRGIWFRIIHDLHFFLFWHVFTKIPVFH